MKMVEENHKDQNLKSKIIPNRIPWTALGFIVILIGLIGTRLGGYFCKSPRDSNTPISAPKILSLKNLLADSGKNYAKVLSPRPFIFPKDHGPHPEYRNEWWYFTGNLRDKLGRQLGYQLTFFRSALAPMEKISQRESHWAASQIYMAHLAVSEVEENTFLKPGIFATGEFKAYERFSRGAQGLAGSQAAPFQVWLEDWSCESIHGDSSFFPLRLKAAQGSISIDLILEEGKKIVLQGEQGFSRKGPEAGNASYYYSFTRMPTKGTIHSNGQTYAAVGNSWMDREWGSSILAAGVAGWDWFSLQLSDSTEFLFFRLRPSTHSSKVTGKVAFDYGIWVDAMGRSHILGRDEMHAEIISFWESPSGGSGGNDRRGRTYPSRWIIDIPSLKLQMKISPKLANQELDLSIPYWEGAIEIDANREGKTLQGEGFMELTGYR